MIDDKDISLSCIADKLVYMYDYLEDDNENLDVLYELKDYAKDNSEVLDVIDSILEMYKEA